MLPFRFSLLNGVAVLLVAYCLTLALLVGDIGFQGDDWWVFSFPYWNSFPDSIYEYALGSRRPIEGVYWISMFEAFHFSRQPYTLFSLLLLAGSSLVLGACLLKAFPSRLALAIVTVFFSFLLPPVSNLTYMIHTDNSRISTLLYWLSVLAFQQWASKSGSRPGLILPILLYCTATLTYENTALLIFAVPGFVWPIVKRQQTELDMSPLMVRMGMAMGISFALFLSMRFLVFSGGAVGHGSLLPSPDLMISYFSTLGAYLSAPLVTISTDIWDWVWGGSVALTAGTLLFFAGRDPEPFDKERDASWVQSNWYVAGLGVVVLLLGVSPYLLAGYSAMYGFTSQSRIYSSGGFGVAILLAAVATISWKSERTRIVIKCFAIALMIFMAVFLAGLRGSWREAAIKRNELRSSLLEQVPGVAPGTTFLFLDLQWYLSNRAVVFQGVDGLPEYIRMLYGEKDLYAYFLYSLSKDFVDSEGRTATVSPRGLTARGSSVRPPIPLDTLLILRRVGSRLVLVDGLSKDRDRVAVDWRGVSTIKSNPKLIRKSHGPISGQANGRLGSARAQYQN